MFFEVMDAMSAKPGVETAVLEMFFRYMQVRCMYDVGGFWSADVPEVSPFRDRAPVTA